MPRANQRRLTVIAAVAAAGACGLMAIGALPLAAIILALATAAAIPAALADRLRYTSANMSDTTAPPRACTNDNVSADDSDWAA